MKAIVTGGASGLGAAMVAGLRSQGLEVEVLDLTTGFEPLDFRFPNVPGPRGPAGETVAPPPLAP